MADAMNLIVASLSLSWGISGGNEYIELHVRQIFHRHSSVDQPNGEATVCSVHNSFSGSFSSFLTTMPQLCFPNHNDLTCHTTTKTTRSRNIAKRATNLKLYPWLLRSYLPLLDVEGLSDSRNRGISSRPKKRFAAVEHY